MIHLVNVSCRANATFDRADGQKNGLNNIEKSRRNSTRNSTMDSEDKPEPNVMFSIVQLVRNYVCTFSIQIGLFLSNKDES